MSRIVNQLLWARSHERNANCAWRYRKNRYPFMSASCRLIPPSSYNTGEYATYTTVRVQQSVIRESVRFKFCSCSFSHVRQIDHRLSLQFYSSWPTSARQSRCILDLYDLCDLHDLYDLAHVAGWKPYNLHHLLIAHVSWVEPVCAMQILRNLSQRLVRNWWSRSWSV